MKENKKSPAILLWDVETSYIVATTFSLYPERLPHDGIIQDWNIICAAWKWLGEKKTSTVAVGPDTTNDLDVVVTLREVLAKADVIVHHNGDKFDIKKLNARLIYYGLEPLPLIPTVDTLKEARKIASFTSNRLDYLGQHLCGEGKVQTSHGLWMRVLKGDIAAVKEMVRYNVGDVLVLEKVYLKLRPYMKRHPHVGVIQTDNKCTCPKCGSVELKKNGIRITAAGVKKQEMQCKSCGSYHLNTMSLTSA